MKFYLISFVLVLLSACATSAPILAPAPELDFTELNKALAPAIVGKTYFNKNVKFGADSLDRGALVKVDSVELARAHTFHDRNSSVWPVTLTAQTTSEKKAHTFQWDCTANSVDEDYPNAVLNCLPTETAGPLITVDPLASYRKSKWLPDLKRMRPAVGMPWEVVADALNPTDCSLHEDHRGHTKYCSAGIGYRVIITEGVITSVHEEKLKK